MHANSFNNLTHLDFRFSHFSLTAKTTGNIQWMIIIGNATAECKSCVLTLGLSIAP